MTGVQDRRWVSVCGWCCLLSLVVLVPVAAAKRGEVVLVSQANGSGGDNHSNFASISADGRFVAFTSAAGNLSTDVVNAYRNVFMRDLQTNTTVLVSLSTAGVGADDDSSAPSISADGRFVAFESAADNLSTEDVNAVQNVFVRDLQTNTTVPVSLSTAGVGADGGSFTPSISADGRFVALASDADNLSGGANGTVTNVFVRDLQTSTTTLASITHDNAAGANGSAVRPSISADGRFVAFESGADNLSPDDVNAFQNVFVRDLQANTTVPVSLSTAGLGGDADSSGSSISADGRFVAFESDADSLSPDDINTVRNVFVRDQQAGTTVPVSLSTAGFGADGESAGSSISADGRFVAFESVADNLSTADNNIFRNVFVRDQQAGTTVPVSLTTAGADADGSSFGPSISADGRFVAFDSNANNLSSADDNDMLNVFRRDLVGPVPGCSPVTLVVAGSIATSVALPCIDEDADPLTRSIVTRPVHGTLGLVDQAAGTVIYTPDPGYVGPDTFTFRAADASGPSAPGSASLTVTTGPPSPPCSDCDGDRYPSTIDCNDRDPATHPGAVDKPGNKIDEDCTGTDATFSELVATTIFAWTRYPGSLVIRRIEVSRLRGGETATIRCTGRRCPFKVKRYADLKKGRRTFGARILKGRRLPHGATVSVRLTAPLTIGTSTVLEVRRRQNPKITRACLQPGAKRPSKCP